MITDAMMTRVDENTESVGIGSAKKTQNTAVLQRYNITARGCPHPRVLDPPRWDYFEA